MNNDNYTRRSVLEALEVFGKPATRDELFKAWIECADMELVRFGERVTTGSGILTVFNAAVSEMLGDGRLYANKQKLCCLAEWRGVNMRSLDDDWHS